MVKKKSSSSARTAGSCSISAAARLRDDLLAVPPHPFGVPLSGQFRSYPAVTMKNINVAFSLSWRAFRTSVKHKNVAAAVPHAKNCMALAKALGASDFQLRAFAARAVAMVAPRDPRMAFERALADLRQRTLELKAALVGAKLEGATLQIEMALARLECAARERAA